MNTNLLRHCAGNRYKCARKVISVSKYVTRTLQTNGSDIDYQIKLFFIVDPVILYPLFFFRGNIETRAEYYNLDRCLLQLKC